MSILARTSVAKGAACLGATVLGTLVLTRYVFGATARRRRLSSTAAPSEPFPKSAVYTRTGDKGTSLLFNGERKPKTDPVFEALGHQDELNVLLGISREFSSLGHVSDMLTEIQSRLFDLGAATATPIDASTKNRIAYTAFSAANTIQLEHWIDEMDSQLPPLKNFILPSGGLLATHLHLSRSVCRRAERATVILVEAGSVDPEVGKYLNRLSDFLFVAARFAALSSGEREIIWKKAKPMPEDSK